MNKTMKSLLRSAGLAGVAGALMLLAAPVSQAAATTSSTSCVSMSDSKSWGDGQITVCPQSDGSVHVTGYVENLQPWHPWDEDPCVAWMINLTGGDYSFTPAACPVYNQASNKVPLDYSFTPTSPVTGATLNTVYYM
ncbi:hypothetical protein [Streptomyces shenzhenensis]|uniref:hypothetical protein n=1 Tax=Streptomyces shenzhenensis TaxID=943815 RepID=UPI001F2FB923|nr:hypothetical protein [Streptomyces shenzhenensis]